MIVLVLILVVLALGRGRCRLTHAVYGLGVMVAFALAVMIGVSLADLGDHRYGPTSFVLAPGPSQAMALPDQKPCAMFCDG
ncbi:hypothetical protein [Nocardia lasii]|uniref:Uncharacterized protein n=1 Tax=Nocardia lasii TaxID=1616107 RepID=A0ABW1JL69_9NOCA